MKWTWFKWIVISLGFTMLVTSSGTYSTWRYAQEKVESITGSTTTILNVFEYAPEEVLPDDVMGENHVVLVSALVGEENGLNKPDSYLNEQIASRQNGGFFKPKRDTLGSMGADQDEELNELFALESENLSFLIQFIDDDTYYIFTTEVELGENSAPNYAIGTVISPIYRTIVEKNSDGVWETKTSAIGYALSAYYEESNILGNITKIPSFDPDSWAAGTPSA